MKLSALIIAVALPAGTIFAQNQPVREPVLLAPPSSPDRVDPNAYSFYVNGLLAAGFGEMEEAALWFKRAYDRAPDSYEIGYALAECYLQIRKPTMALDVLLQIHPRDIPAYHLSAIAYRMMGDEESAHGLCLKILELDSSDLGALRALAMTFRQQNRQDSLLLIYELLVRNGTPYDASAWSEVGRLRTNLGDSARALEAFSRSLTLDSTRTNLHTYLLAAELFDIAGHPDSAARLLGKALQIDPDNSAVHRELVLHYYYVDSMSLALRHQQAVVRLSPLDRKALYRLAVLYLNADSLAPADSILSYLIESGDPSVENRMLLGTVAMERRDYDKARQQFREVVTVADTSVEAWYRLSETLFLQGDTAGSEQSLRDGLARAVSPDNVLKLNLSLAAVLERRGKVEEVLALYERLLPDAPENAQLLNNYGYTLAVRGERLEYALTLTTRAIALEPNNGAYLDSHGWVLHLLSRDQEGLTFLLKAAELTPDPTVYEHIGDVYAALRELANARIWWNKALELMPKNKDLAEKVRQE